MILASVVMRVSAGEFAEAVGFWFARECELIHAPGILKTRIPILLLLLAFCGPAPAQTPQRASRDAQALLQSAMGDFDQKKYDEALAKLADLDKKTPNDPFILNLIGAAYTRKKDYATAQQNFEKALAIQPGFFPARFNVGELMFLQRQYAEALTFFRKMLEADPRNELLQFKVFLCYIQLNQKEEALKALKLIKYPGDTPAWYYGQAAWESKQGNNKKALEYLTGARYIFGPKTALFDETFEDLDIKLR